MQTPARARLSLPVLLLLGSAALHGKEAAKPYKFFRQHAGLNEVQIEAIKGGTE